jgi:hypothetical protein
MKEIYLCAHGNDHTDEQRLRTGLNPILARFDLSLWGTRDIMPSSIRVDEIKSHLQNAEVFVALVSSDFLASDNCMREVQAADYRAIHDGLKIVSILIRPVAFFEFTELAPYQTLPKSGKAIANYSDRDTAWTEVLRDLMEMISVSHRYIA